LNKDYRAFAVIYKRIDQIGTRGRLGTHYGIEREDIKGLLGDLSSTL